MSVRTQFGLFYSITLITCIVCCKSKSTMLMKLGWDFIRSTNLSSKVTECTQISLFDDPIAS